jgi:hypothetical protein
MILTSHAGTINVPAGGDLQSYINQASPGDEIRFTTVSNCNAAIDKNLTITGMGANGSGYSDLTALDLNDSILRVVSSDPSNPILVTVSNVRFRIGDGTMSNSGGGIDANSANLAIQSCKFTSSPGFAQGSSWRGAGIHAVSCNIQIDDTGFAGLKAGQGGAIFGSLSNIEVTDSTFYHCGDLDGMIVAEDHFIATLETGDLQMAEEQLYEEGTTGGAIHVESSNLTLTDSASSDVVANLGGLVYAVRSAVDFEVGDGVGGADIASSVFGGPSSHRWNQATLGVVAYSFISDVGFNGQSVIDPSSYLAASLYPTGIFDMTWGSIDVTGSYLSSNPFSIEPLHIRPWRQGRYVHYTEVINFDLTE